MTGAVLGNRASSRQPLGRLGFSLIEIIVALSILAMAVVGLMRAFDVSMSWAGRSNDQTIAVNLAQQRLEQLKAWVEGSPDQLVRSTRLASLSAPPWLEARAPLSGELSRFERETAIEDAGDRFASTGGGQPGKVMTVRIFLGRATTPVAELTTIVTERP